MKHFYCFVLLFSFISIGYSQTLTKSQAIADIDYFNSKLQEVHYNPFLFISENAYKQKTDSIKNSISDSVGIKQLILKLSSLSSSLHDGHCMPAIVQPALKDDFKKQLYFPVELVAGPGFKVYVPDQPELNGIPAGAELIS